MGVIYRLFGRPLLALQDSERAHLRSLKLLRFLSNNPLSRTMLRIVYNPQKSVSVEVLGQRYKHPFGLAAGMDKNAVSLRGWEATGLGFIEIGGVTQHKQDGNAKPRMFRADKTKALVNRMGFNNQGSQQIAENLQKHFKKYGAPGVPIWVNLGKSKTTSLDDAHTDYASTMKLLWPFADVFVVNVSSPNTPNLRELQNEVRKRKKDVEDDLYAHYWIFPNLMLNFYSWGLSINIVEPISTDKTRVHFLTFPIDENDDLKDTIVDLIKVEYEDQTVVESVCKGMKSRFYDSGRYSPKHERGVHYFHSLLSRYI